MKIFSPKIIRKSPKSKIDSSIKRIINSPKGPKLRSRKIIYEHQHIVQESDEDIPQKMQSSPKTKLKKNQKKETKNQRDQTKKVAHNINFQNLLKLQKQDRFDQSEEDPFENFDEENSQQKKEQIKVSLKRKKRQSRPFPLKRIISCEIYNKVKEIDLMIYFRILTKSKMFSTLLLNELGQVIFADRLGSEHFQGSLNNFSRNPIYSMILECKLEKFFEKIQIISKTEPTVLKLLIYSKNSKRRYSKSSNELSLTNQDLFNRYLKCLSCQIMPIQIVISSTEQFQGYWNKNLFQLNKPLKCFLLKSRLSKTMPQLESLNLKEDKKIEKFLKYTRKKQAEKDLVKIQDQISEENLANQNSEECGVQKFFDNSFLNKKDIENIYSQMNEEIKHSKSTLTRGFFINSGDGKQKCSFD